jgi:polyphenol oxidase
MLSPDWAAPARALMSTRAGGVSVGAFASMNLSRVVGDDPAAVAENRHRFEAALGVPVAVPWMVHGADVVRVEAGRRWSENGGTDGPLSVDDAQVRRTRPQADGLWTTERGVACGVTAADCLPVLLASGDGRVVGAAHAGWRGLAAGVLEATVRAMCEGAGVEPSSLHAWLGPCIGPAHFEVGADVLAAFDADPQQPPATFTPRRRADGSMAWLANLPVLARDRLHAAGVRQLSGDTPCTVADASRFFSFRRDRVTGRMLAAVARID